MGCRPIAKDYELNDGDLAIYVNGISPDLMHPVLLSKVVLLRQLLKPFVICRVDSFHFMHGIGHVKESAIHEEEKVSGYAISDQSEIIKWVGRPVALHPWEVHYAHMDKEADHIQNVPSLDSTVGPFLTAPNG